MEDAEFIKLIHIGKHGCGKPAVLIKASAYIKHTRVRSGDVRHLDGRPMIRFERMICDSCGKGFVPHQVQPEIKNPHTVADVGSIKACASRSGMSVRQPELPDAANGPVVLW